MGSNNDISLKALAKINLGLDVVRRREDGYHEVRMIMQTIHLYDRLDIKRTKEPGIQIQTNLSFLPVNENNLIYKAAKLLMDEFSITDGVSVKLDKRIPVAAGMAGGSTDAAAMLIGVNRLFSLGLTKKQLMERGVQIIASPREHELITTDPRDIARIRQRQHIEEARRRRHPTKEKVTNDE